MVERILRWNLAGSSTKPNSENTLTCILASTSTKPCDSSFHIITKWDTLLCYELDTYHFSLHLPPINTPPPTLHFLNQQWWVFVCRFLLMQNTRRWSPTMFQRVTLQFTSEISKRRGLWFRYHIWSTPCFLICWTEQKKSLGSTIPWEASPFLAKKKLSSISLLKCVPSQTDTIVNYVLPTTLNWLTHFDYLLFLYFCIILTIIYILCSLSG